MTPEEKVQLYRQIIQQGDEYTIVSRMQLLGFWPSGEGIPADPPEEAQERAAIELEIKKLRYQHSSVKNPEKALAEERKRRWEESKQKRLDRKLDRQLQAQQRREEFDALRATTIVHAGEGVSAGLQSTTGDDAALAQRNLPVMHRAEELAAHIGINISSLRWLTYHRRGATVVHYHRYDIAKKTGGVRAISAPKAALAKCQRWVLENILARLEPTDQSHGFIPGRSILTNAQPHTQRQVVINLDLKDFFPSITFRRVKGLFVKIGYSEHLATTLALLCTEPPRAQAEHRGKLYHVALGDRVLPQGACTSPAITNAICRRLDHRLAGLARRYDFTFTRYADDLTFSGNDKKLVGKLLKCVADIVESEGFTLHPTKTHIMRESRRQEVTGVTVNQRPTISRKEIRRLRAILHNAKTQGLESQNRDGHPNFSGYVRGRIAFVSMIDPNRGEQLMQAFNQLR